MWLHKNHSNVFSTATLQTGDMGTLPAEPNRTQTYGSRLGYAMVWLLWCAHTGPWPYSATAGCKTSCWQQWERSNWIWGRRGSWGVQSWQSWHFQTLRPDLPWGDDVLHGESDKKSPNSLYGWYAAVSHNVAQCAQCSEIRAQIFWPWRGGRNAFGKEGLLLDWYCMVWWGPVCFCYFKVRRIASYSHDRGIDLLSSRSFAQIDS